jgi:hypothetical protein
MIHDFHFFESGFFSNFSLCGLPGCFAGLYMALGDCPSILGILREQYLNLSIFISAKYDAAGGGFSQNVLYGRATLESIF